MADLDVTFFECEGGALSDKFHDFVDILETAFSSSVNQGQNFQTNFGFYQAHINELWRSVDNHAEGGSEDVVGDGSIFFGLIATLLLDAGANEYLGPVVIDGGPGCSSACRLFFSEAPENTVTEMYNLLATTFTNATAATSSN